MSRLLAAFVIAWLATPVRAQAPEHGHRYALNWVRGPGAQACISSSELAQRIEELIGPVFRAPDAADRAIEGLIEPATSGSGYAVHVRIAEREGASVGERAFESDAAGCGALNDSIVLVILLMVDPSASERGLPPELLGMLDDSATPAADLLADLERERTERERQPARQPPPVQTEATPAAKRAPPTPRATDSMPAPASAPFGFDLALIGALAYQLQPNFEPGIGLVARLRTPTTIAVELGVSSWLSDDVVLTDDLGRRAVTTFGATTAALSACLPIATPGELEITACAGATLVARWFESDLAKGSYERKHAQLGPNAAIDARYVFARHWFVLASTGALAMLPGTSFSYTSQRGRQLLYEPSLFGLWLAVGAGARI